MEASCKQVPGGVALASRCEPENGILSINITPHRVFKGDIWPVDDLDRLTPSLRLTDEPPDQNISPHERILGDEVGWGRIYRDDVSRCISSLDSRTNAVVVCEHRHGMTL